MMYLILYDISDTNLRTKIAKLLLKEGAERIQYSVFITPFSLKNNNLQKKISNLLKEKPDEKLFIIPLLKRNFYNTKIMGNLNLDLEYLANDNSSLTL